MGKYSKPAEFRVKDKVNLAKSTDVSAGVQSKVYYSITYVSDGQYVNSKVPLSKSTDVSVGTGVGVKSVLFREDGKVNLSKSTDISADVGVGVEPVNVEEVLSTKKQLIRNRDDFVYIGILIGIIFICIMISAEPLYVWLTDLYGVEKGKIGGMLIFMAVSFIFVALESVLVFLYEEFDNKYAHEEYRG